MAVAHYGWPNVDIICYSCGWSMNPRPDLAQKPDPNVWRRIVECRNRPCPNYGKLYELTPNLALLLVEYQEKPMATTATRPPNNLSIDQRLEHIFTYHSSLDKAPQFEAIRQAAKQFARVLLENTPVCADQTAALRKIREAVYTANASLALDGVS